MAANKPCGIRKSAAIRGVHAIAFVFAAALLVAACAGTDEPEYVERPVDELYNEAVDMLEAQEYKEASKLFDEVDRQHPYSPWATKAQVMAAYAHYQANQYDEAVAALDRFIELHPANPEVAYAYYLKGLCYYEQISDVGRDQEMTEEARKTFEELLTRFPNSPYARDARLKLDLTIDNLAGKEMEIGRFYLKRGYYLAAINRFKVVIDKYQTTTHTPEALHRLAEAYTAVGLNEEAQKVAAVLGYNYPGSEWYVDSYALLRDSSVRVASPEPWYKLW